MAELQWFAFGEFGFRDRAGRPSLIGLRDTVTFPEFPAVLSRGAIVACFAVTEGEFLRAAYRLVGPGNQVVAGSEICAEAMPAKGLWYALGLTLWVHLKVPGRYTIELWSGEKVSGIPLRVEQGTDWPS